MTYTYDGDGRMVKSVMGDVVTYYVGTHYEKTAQGSQQNLRKYYFAGASRLAMRENGTLIWLLSDHLGGTSVTADANGNLLSSLRYSAFGEVRAASGVTGTDYRYTGQRSEAEIGLYYYVARFYDPALGRFISADANVPSVENDDTSNLIRFTPKTNSSALVVDYHEVQFLTQLTHENINRLSKHINSINNESLIAPPFVPTNPVAFDRYAYAFNNPIRYIDPTGHSSTSPQEVGNWLRDNIKFIWNTAPTWASNLFNGPGRRIIMVDKPHATAKFYHINSDLKVLETINHKSIEPLLVKVAVAKTAIDMVSASVAKAAVQIANSSTFLLLERMPLFIIPIPRNWPYPTQKKA